MPFLRQLFIAVICGGLIWQRKINYDEVPNYEMTGDKVKENYMLAGYIHNIDILCDAEDVVTLM